MITPPQIALVVTNLVAVVGIVYYMSTVLGKRIDALDKRMDDLNVNMNVRFNELSHQITRIDDMSILIPVLTTSHPDEPRTTPYPKRSTP